MPKVPRLAGLTGCPQLHVRMFIVPSCMRISLDPSHSCCCAAPPTGLTLERLTVCGAHTTAQHRSRHQEEQQLSAQPLVWDLCPAYLWHMHGQGALVAKLILMNSCMLLHNVPQLIHHTQ